MIKGAKLEFRLSKICHYCGKDFLSRQANSKRCNDCKTSLAQRIPCKCGCGQLCKITNRSGYYSAGCKSRGKTYQEIYNKDRSLIKNGFQKGLKNPNHTSKVFQKFKLKNPDRNGTLFRSTKEAQFSNFCLDNNLKYQYEVRVPLINGKYKVVDFVIDDSIYIEITGYAYKKWQMDFDTKFQLLRASIDNPMMVLTYTDKLSLVRDHNNKSKDIFFESIDNEDGILKKIRLFQATDLMNNYIKSHEAIH